MNKPAISLSIFPALKNKKAAFINLNDCARAARHQPARSPFLNPRLTDRFLRHAHRKNNVAYSLGGYLEDRRDLWRGSYLDPEHAVHLGIDVNAPAGTDVSVARPAHVMHIVHDPDQDGGWGTVVMLALDKPCGLVSHFLYAHLSAEEINVREGDAVQPGTIIGRLGRHDENGGWYEHLHVQAMTAEAWDLFHGDLKLFDGYAAHPGQPEHPLFPDPMPLLT